jgi:multicomponent Na+:H+ antiporter subunit G
MIGCCLIGIGILFDIIGCIGLIRMPDLYTRLQAATKGVTVGTSSIMFGVFLFSGFSEIGIKALLVVIFLMLTAPVSTHAIARGARIFSVKMAKETVCDAYAEEKRSEPRT